MNPSNTDEQIWALLRERSLQPGGFGEDRARIWPALLGAQPLSDPPPYSEVDRANEYRNPPKEGVDEPMADPHADERQIKLDTDRSFVLYPGESDTTSARDALQNDLRGLLVLLFRKRRSLHYFQGFHDIMTVIFLTLPRPLHLACAEKMALHRVRDAMGVGLEPILGLLRILRNLLRLVDPAYAQLLESVSPLPYHALSNLLTLFSHEVPTLPLIQHVWDFLLSREPIAVVWLAAVFIIHRKPSIHLLIEQDEEGMIHSLLGGMPELVDSEAEPLNASHHDCAPGTITEADGTTGNEAASERLSRSNLEADSHGSRSGVIDAMPVPHDMNGTRVSHEAIAANEDGHGEHSQNAVSRSNTPLADDSSVKLVSFSDATACKAADDPQSSTLELACSIPLPESRPGSPTPTSGPSSSVHSTIPLPQEGRERSSSVLDDAPSYSRSSSLDSIRLPRTESVKLRNKSPPLSLTYLLRQADDLLNAYPPSHPSLYISEVMGPDSAMRTWRPLPISTKDRSAIPEKPLYDETDDYLETLVNSSQVVIPSPPPSPPPGPRLSAKKARASPRTPRKALLDPRRIGRRLGALTAAERRVLFMGALLVVGAAVALKSSKSSCVDGIIKASGGEGLKRLWNSKLTMISSVVAAWGRGLP